MGVATEIRPDVALGGTLVEPPTVNVFALAADPFGSQ